MYLSIDYGKKRIGLAVGAVFPKGAGVLDGAKPEAAVLEIDQKAKEAEALGIVIGMPIRSAGEEGTIAKEIREFAQRVADKTGLPIYFEPEQYTSMEAKETIMDFGQKVEKNGRIDEIAAVLILERFLQTLQSYPQEIEVAIRPTGEK
jgi:putative Holliday junction resolvase